MRHVIEHKTQNKFNTVCEENFPYDFPCFVACFQVCVLDLASLGSQLFVGLRHPIGWSGKTVDLEQRGSRFRMGVKTPHQTRIHVSPSLSTIDSLNDLVKY